MGLTISSIGFWMTRGPRQTCRISPVMQRRFLPLVEWSKTSSPSSSQTTSWTTPFTLWSYQSSCSLWGRAEASDININPAATTGLPATMAKASPRALGDWSPTMSMQRNWRLVVSIALSCGAFLNTQMATQTWNRPSSTASRTDLNTTTTCRITAKM